MGEMAFGCRAVSYRRPLSKNCAGINPDAVLRADLAPGGEADGTKNCPIMSVRLYRVAVWTSRLPFFPTRIHLSPAKLLSSTVLTTRHSRARFRGEGRLNSLLSKCNISNTDSRRWIGSPNA